MDGIILILRDDSETKKGQIVYKYGCQLVTEKERTDVGDPDNEKGKERRKMFLSKKNLDYTLPPSSTSDPQISLCAYTSLCLSS